MTRAILVALAVSTAAIGQEPPPLPLPDAAAKPPPALPLPDAKPAPGLALPLPDAKPAKKKTEARPPPLPLDGAPKPASPADKPKPAETAQKPAAEKPAVAKPETAAQKAATRPDATAAQKPAEQPRNGAMPLFDGGVPAMLSAKPPTIISAPAPKGAVPAADVNGQAARTMPAGGHAPAAAIASPMAPSADLRLRQDYTTQLWSVRAFAGGERSTESDYTDAASNYHLGAEVTRWFNGVWLARGQLDWRNSTQSYVPLHSTGGSAQQEKLDENRFDFTADVGYDFGERVLDNGRLELTPMLGVQYLAIRNSAFPSDLIGPNLAGRARYALSSAVTLHGTIGYTYNLSVASTQNSALKAPKGDFSARAGLGLPLAGGFELDLDYSGDIIGFENTYRVANGAALGFGTTF